MNSFDLIIIHFFNSFAHRSWIADATVVIISGNHFLIGGVLLALFWWAWIEHGKESMEKREALIFVLIAVTFAVSFARTLALSLPYRERPLHNPLIHFQLPYTLDPSTLINWSSFPSDHAVVVFCLAAGLWTVSRRLGALAISYAFLISLPRIYLGYHYPTDILAGALLGIGVASLSRITTLRRTLARIILDPLDPRPAYLYSFLFLWTFEIGDMFNSLMQFVLLGGEIERKFPSWRLEETAVLLLIVAVVSLLTLLLWRKHKSHFHTN
ncbi:MAG: phosphatase PAP2 family protein [Halobacteriota archaeon]|jgi:undecaprenyl-diphosphatase